MLFGRLSKPRISCLFGVGPSDDLLGIKNHAFSLKIFILRCVLALPGFHGYQYTSKTAMKIAFRSGHPTKINEFHVVTASGTFIYLGCSPSGLNLSNEMAWSRFTPKLKISNLKFQISISNPNSHFIIRLSKAKLPFFKLCNFICDDFLLFRDCART